MKSPYSTHVLAITLLLLLVAGCGGQDTSNTPDDADETASNAQLVIEEWTVEWENSRPRDPYVAPDGRVWFCGQRDGYLAVLDPETGETTRFDLGEGAGPHNLIVDADGMVWYAGNRRAHIGRLDPATGDVTTFDMPVPEARDPHTLVWAPDGNIWFTLQGSNMVGHLNTETGEVELMSAPTDRSRPYGIWMDSQGTPWVALFGTNRIAHVDTEAMELVEFELPNEDARPRRLVVTSDDRVWVGDYTRGYLGAYNPADGSYEEWAMPSAEKSRPYAMEVDSEDRVWFVETGVQPNLFTAFNTATETFEHATPVPSGGGTVRHMYRDPAAGAIWFGTDANTVGRALLP